VPPSTFVIVGANLAGGRAAETLRKDGFDERIVLVGEEPHRPYMRPPLSKDVLRGESEPESVFVKPVDFYDDNGIELRLGVRATGLDPSGSVTLSAGETIGFDTCLLATGGRVRTLDVPGAERVRYLRTLDDAMSLGLHGRVVVVGAGFIGAEVAASARQLGCDVTLLEVLPLPLMRVLPPDVAQLYAAIHADHGVDVRLGEGVESVTPDAVVGTSGRRYAADVVVAGVGIVPADELARDAGLACDDGIVVDERCRTSAPKVFAAGDVARHPNPILGETIRVEHFQNAQNQGRAAARAMLGHAEPFAEVPWFWSDQYDVNLQMLGHPSAADETVLRGSIGERSFTVFYVRGDRVRAAIALNRGIDIGATRRLIERAVPVSPARLRDPGVAIRDLLRPGA
jgi:3-phenylpropionate/trans-cinnamate dioxygenase ferredoxin reductase subunit